MRLPKSIFNKLELKGTEVDLVQFLEDSRGIDPNIFSRVEENPLCFNNFLPLSEVIFHSSQIELERLRLEKWGCPSDALSTSVEILDRKMLLRFITGDLPPTKLIQALKNRYPRIEFKHTID